MAEVNGLIERDARRAGPHDYESFHAQRFAYLLETARRLRPEAQRVLDVGCGPFTQMARGVFPEVWTLGFEGQAADLHIAYDLNAIQQGATPSADAGFDLIIFAEVVEHLHVPAAAALLALKAVLNPGGVILLQTPNAAEVMNRVALLWGRNPYERLRLTPLNPGHFREYTLDELADDARAAGLEVIFSQYRDYFPAERVRGFHPVRFLLDQARKVVPSFRAGITMALAADADG
jgi:SAM-dependent methyltransferase